MRPAMQSRPPGPWLQPNQRLSVGSPVPQPRQPVVRMTSASRGYDHRGLLSHGPARGSEMSLLSSRPSGHHMQLQPCPEASFTVMPPPPRAMHQSVNGFTAPPQIRTVQAPSNGLVQPAKARESSARPRRVAAAGDFLEEGHRSEPWLTEESQQKRRSAMGFDEPRTTTFAAEREFLSIGCFCGVARALQSLGLKKLAYPFDWVRASSEGVILVLDSRFEDFLTYSHIANPPHLSQPVFTGSRWGGSFWHHNPEAPATAEDFTRRAERFLGLREIPMSKPRVFVRAVNSTRELDSVAHLLEALRRAFPETDDLRLLVLIDLQKTQGPICLQDVSSDILLFYTLHEDLFPTSSGKSSSQATAWSMQRHAEAYAEALSFAAAFWAGVEGKSQMLKQMPDLRTLAASCEQWDGGATTGELFLPRRIKGPRLKLAESPADYWPEAPLSPASPGPPPKIQAFESLGKDVKATDYTPSRGFEEESQVAELRQEISRLRRALAEQPQASHGPQSAWCNGSLPAWSQAPDSRSATAALQTSSRGSVSEAFIVIPAEAAPGDILQARAFGLEIHVEVPQDACPGNTLQLLHCDGKVTCELRKSS